MGFTFSKKAAASSVTPTVASVKTGESFQTEYGTIYTKLANGDFLKLGNPDKPGRNEVVVKPASYFGSGNRNDITVLETLNISF